MVRLSADMNNAVVGNCDKSERVESYRISQDKLSASVQMRKTSGTWRVW